MPSPWTEDLSHAKTPFRFIVEVSKPYRWFALGTLFFIVFSAGLGAVEPIIYKNIVDSITAVAQGGSYNQVWLWAGIYLGVTATILALWRVIMYIGSFWVLGARATGRYALSSYLLKHSHHYFENRFAGSTANKIAHAADGAKNIIEDTIFNGWPFVVTMLVSIGVAFHAGVFIGSIFTLWLCVAIPVNYFLSRRRTEYSLRAQASETKLRGATVDVVSNIRAVQEYARNFFELGLIKKMTEERRIAGFKNWMFGQRIMIINSILQIVFMGGMILTATYLAYHGVITPGTIILVLALATSVGDRIFFLGSQMANFAEHWGEIREGLGDLLNEYDVPDARGAKPLRVREGGIELKNVAFSYHEGESVLHNFTLSVLPGQKIGLVGRSGAGKTTLAKLLLRHYDISGGSIEIDGQNIAGVTQDSVRDAISVVPQEPLLFHRTIKENIAYGKEGATYEDIRRAAELAQAHGFIKTLPQGYDTLVGERGVKLSGGQRQRVAIARALLKPARILILDEATSSLDSESESDIQKGLESLMEGKTVIAIAHRLSTLRAMDRILVLENGQVVEDGTHDKLIRKRKGVYGQMWKRQSGGYLKDE